ncbi:MAG: Lrp/AsnC family transcriptional regulator [Sneathiella sp.]
MLSEFDDQDKKILRTLQSEGRLSNIELAERTGMSTSPCWRRVKRFENEGVIQGYSANLDRRKLGLGVLVFVSVQIDTHSEEEASIFEQEIVALEEVISCHSVGGGADFMLQVACKDLDAYAEFSMTVLRRLTGIKAMTSSIALKEIKANSGWPLLSG